MVEFELGGNTYKAIRFGLKRWLELEEVKPDVNTGRDEFVDKIYLYLSIALEIDIETLLQFPWYEIATAYGEIVVANLPKTDFPILRATTKDVTTKSNWEYPGRTWYVWAHLLSKNYGWELEVIEKLDIDDAIALIEEIMVENQLDREWEWALSPTAYQYNEATKKSEFKPLPRPRWMQDEVEPPKKLKIPKSLIPMGKIVHLNTPGGIDESTKS